MKSIFFLLLIFELFIFCKEDKKKVFVEEVEKNIKQELYTLAEEEIEERLKSARHELNILSSDKIKNPRHIAITRNQEKILWVEDDNLYFKNLNDVNLENQNISSVKLLEYPSSFSISDSGWFALIEYKLKNKNGCRLVVLSFFKKQMKYESGANITCKNKPSVSNDGSHIYYFIDDNLYEEKTKKPPNPRLIAKKKELAPPYPKMKTQFYIYPISSHSFIIFSGNAGAYNLYYFNPYAKDKIKLITKEVLTYKYFYSGENSGLLIKGVIGNMMLYELKYQKTDIPKLNRLFSIGRRHSNPWKTNMKNQFLSGNAKEIYLWQPMRKREVLPLLCEQFWLVKDNQILCESKHQLFLQQLKFSEDDWKLLKLYEEATKSSID